MRQRTHGSSLACYALKLPEKCEPCREAKRERNAKTNPRRTVTWKPEYDWKRDGTLKRLLSQNRAGISALRATLNGDHDEA